MDHVLQEYADGCGVACLAMVTGISYWESLAVLHPHRYPGDFMTSHETSNESLIEELKRAGFEVTVRIRPDIRTLKDSVLVVRYLINKKLYMHTVVWDSEQQLVLDPFDDRPFEEYESGLCLAFELSRSGPSGASSSAPPA